MKRKVGEKEADTRRAVREAEIGLAAQLIMVFRNRPEWSAGLARAKQVVGKPLGFGERERAAARRMMRQLEKAGAGCAGHQVGRMLRHGGDPAADLLGRLQPDGVGRQREQLQVEEARARLAEIKARHRHGAGHRRLAPHQPVCRPECSREIGLLAGDAEQLRQEKRRPGAAGIKVPADLPPQREVLGAPPGLVAVALRRCKDVFAGLFGECGEIRLLTQCLSGRPPPVEGTDHCCGRSRAPGRIALETGLDDPIEPAVGVPAGLDLRRDEGVREPR